MDTPPFDSLAPIEEQTHVETSSGKLLIGRMHDTGDRPLPNWCPYATTLLGWSEADNATYLIQIRCKRWGCRVCGERKAKSLAMKVAEAKPNRFMTLTVNNAREETPRQAWLNNTPKIPQLIKLIRKRVGEVEYFRVLEVTKAGWPHWHFLIRSKYIPQKFVSEEWSKLTGAHIVDIRQVQKTFAAYRYCVKYLAKQRYVPWTDRRTTWSKNFFPEPEPFESVRIKFDQKQFVDKPPHFMLSWLAGASPVDVVSSDCIAIRNVNLVGKPRTKDRKSRHRK